MLLASPPQAAAINPSRAERRYQAHRCLLHRVRHPEWPKTIVVLWAVAPSKRDTPAARHAGTYLRDEPRQQLNPPVMLGSDTPRPPGCCREAVVLRHCSPGEDGAMWIEISS